ncbi:MAG: hypothetical protein PUF12_01590 [Thermoflexaceae bacterium]|nr:hypothetical protein [Thermoflexaceae bacterium]
MSEKSIRSEEEKEKAIQESMQRIRKERFRKICLLVSVGTFILFIMVKQGYFDHILFRKEIEEEEKRQQAMQEMMSEMTFHTVLQDIEQIEKNMEEDYAYIIIEEVRKSDENKIELSGAVMNSDMPSYVKLGVATADGIKELELSEQTGMEKGQVISLMVEGMQVDGIEKGDIIAPMTRLHQEDEMVIRVCMDEQDPESGQAAKKTGDTVCIQTEKEITEAQIKDIAGRYDPYVSILEPGKTWYVHLQLKKAVSFADCQTVLVTDENGSRLGTATVYSCME